MDHNPEATIGKTQGGMASPTLFNVAVNSIFLHWLSLTVEDKSAIHYGFGVAVGSSIGIFMRMMASSDRGTWSGSKGSSI